MLQVLYTLVSDRRNLIFIISECNNETILNAFNSFKGIGLASNNGYFFTIITGKK